MINISFLKWLRGPTRVRAGAFFLSGDVECSLYLSESKTFVDDTISFTSQFSIELVKTGIHYILNRAE